MKRLLTVCMMLAALTMIAFAGESKDVKYDAKPDMDEKSVVQDRDAMIQDLLYRFEHGGMITDAEKVTLEEYWAARDEENRDPFFQGLDATGGPDGFGYVWRDDNADTVVYAWDEIGSVAAGGTQLTTIGQSDVANVAITPTFAFPFYGINRTTLLCRR